jgi:hypothetical protein
MLLAADPGPGNARQDEEPTLVLGGFLACSGEMRGRRVCR